MDIDINKLMKSIEKAQKIKKEEEEKDENVRKLVKKAQMRRG
jgi:hypothetical protein